MTDDDPCSLCGRHLPRGQVHTALSRFPEEPTYRAIPRCRDAYTCRDTVEGRGESWPLLASVGWVVRLPQPVLVAEGAPDIDPWEEEA